MGLAWALAGGAGAATDAWDLPPVRYGETEPGDAMTVLGRELAAGRQEAPRGSTLELLKWLLGKLKVPQESQVLVFSKTSLQNERIHPGNPRALFFSENTYVGYVPGGAIEVIAHDPLLGPVFHVVSPQGAGVPVVTRETSCLSCHGNARTEDVPGMLVRSVFPDADGQPLLGHGSFLITHESPIGERWGGYYVTGAVGKPHLGNVVFREGERPKAGGANGGFDLAAKIDVTKYPRGTSDVVALLVLEHQCRTHNLLTSGSMHYRRAHWLAKSADPAGDPEIGTAGRVADTAAAAIVDALLFKGEADLGDGVEGDPAFQKMFEARYPRTKDGASLADFRLYGRLFKNRCSHMVYSDSFRALPQRVKSAVFARLREVLEGDKPSAGFGYLSASERKRIAEILGETVEGYRGN